MSGIGVGLILLGEWLRLWANGYVGHVKVNWTQSGRHGLPIGRFVTGIILMLSDGAIELRRRWRERTSRAPSVS